MDILSNIPSYFVNKNSILTTPMTTAGIPGHFWHIGPLKKLGTSLHLLNESNHREIITLSCFLMTHTMYHYSFQQNLLVQPFVAIKNAQQFLADENLTVKPILTLPNT